MSGIKISGLPQVPSALMTDFFPVVQSGITQSETVSQLLALVNVSTTSIKQPVRVATTGALTVTQAGAGPGATLTNSGAQVALSIDGVSLSVGDRVLVKNQASGSQNGIYTVTNVGSGATNWVLTRATDFDGSATGTLVQGVIIAVISGTVNAGSLWFLSTAGPYTVDTTALTFLSAGPAMSGGIVTFAAGGTSANITPVNSAIFITNNSGVSSLLGPLTNGQIAIGSTGAAPVASTITAGANISVSNGAGSITIAATGAASFAWTTVSGTSQTMSSNNGYIANNAGLVTLTLPATSAVGDELAITGKGAGGWLIAQAAGQQIHIGQTASTVGVGGSVASAHQFDSLYLVCITANTIWTTVGAPMSTGLTIV